MTSIRNTFAALPWAPPRWPVPPPMPRPRSPGPPPPRPNPRRLTVRQVYDTLTSAGYRNITEIELEHGRYDVKADNPQGQRVKLRVDAQNGAVLRSRLKD